MYFNKNFNRGGEDDDDDIQSDEESDDYDDESEESDEDDEDGGGRIGNGYNQGGSGVFINRNFNNSGTQGSGLFINRGFESKKEKKKPSGIFINRSFNQEEEIQSDESDEDDGEDESEEGNSEQGMNSGSGIFINRSFNTSSNQLQNDDEKGDEGEESERDQSEEDLIGMGYGIQKRIDYSQDEESEEDDEDDDKEEEEDDVEEDRSSYSSRTDRSMNISLDEFMDERNTDILRTLLITTNPIKNPKPVKRDAEGFRIPDEDTSYDPNYYNCLYEPRNKDDLKLRPTEPQKIVGKDHENKEYTKLFLEGMKLGKTPNKKKKKMFENDAGPIIPINQILKDYELEIQSIKESVSGYIAKVQEEEDAKDLKKRRHVYAEILGNEQDYVINLKLFHRVYVKPMKSFVREDLHRTMNMAVLTIIGINEPFLKEMLKCYEEGKSRGQPEPIGLEDLFSRPQTNQAFKLYFTYVLHYTDWLKEIKELMVKDEKFSKFCNEVNDKLKYSGKRKTAITSFLPQPYQHICRYKLLLNELLKRTPKTLPEHRGVKRALRKMSKITKFVNEKKKEVRTREKARQLFSKIPSLKELVHSEIILDADGYIGAGKRTAGELWLWPSCLVIIQGRKANRMNLLEGIQVSQSKEDPFVLVISPSSKKEVLFRCDSPAKCMKYVGQVRHQADKVGGHGGKVMEFRSGWLHKEEGTLLRKWKKYWVVVHSDRSIIVMKEKGSKIKMKESLIDGKFGVKDPKKFQFYIKTKKANMVFRAEHENDINSWFVALRMVELVQEDHL